MAFTGTTIDQRARDILQDPGAVRWTAALMLSWLNAAIVEMILFRPDAFSKRAPLALVAGVRQALPAGAVKLLEIPCNTGGRYVSKVIDRRQLDAAVPGWRQSAGSKTIKHFLYDEREDLFFDVYPPALVGASLDVVAAVKPAEITDLTTDMPVLDILQNAMVDYVLYRNFQKDAEYAGNAQRSGTHMQAFAGALNGELGATVKAAPTTRGSANAAAVTGTSK